MIEGRAIVFVNGSSNGKNKRKQATHMVTHIQKGGHQI